MSSALLESASRLPNPVLRRSTPSTSPRRCRSRSDLEILLSYDQRLIAAAASHGLPTAAPV
jgi:hypothetical protein